MVPVLKIMLMIVLEIFNEKTSEHGYDRKAVLM